MEYRNISKWVKVSTSAIYKKVVQLEEKGYIHGELIKDGNMPEKAVYHITENGDSYFISLMKQLSQRMVNVFLEFNSVIINLEMVNEPDKKGLIDNIESEINQYKNAVMEIEKERDDIPLTGKTILKQQVLLSQALSEWVVDFKQLYLGE